MSPRQARTAGILDDIIFNKRQEVTALKVQLDTKKIKKLIKELPPTRNFHKAIAKGKISLIAEIKMSAPSAGVIAEKFEPVYLAKTYEESGAAAVSVLTDEKFFQGRLEHLKAAKDSTTIPVLRKDFIIDESQIYESRVAGADAILLIARILSDEQLTSFLDLAHSLKLDCLVDFQTTVKLMDKYPELRERIVVSESGIESADQVRRLKAKGVSAILVGTSLMKSKDIGAKIRELIK